MISNRYYRAHRLIWLLVTGAWPKNQIDHINMIETDNRWCNLREVTHHQNQFNKKCRNDSRTGIKGVSKQNGCKGFSARITKNGKMHWLGSFDTVERAAEAYAKAAKKFHGEFGRVA